MKTHDIIVHPSNAQEMNVIKAFMEALKIKFEIAKDSPYDPEFVAKIENSRKQVAEGDFTRVEKEDLKKFLGL